MRTISRLFILLVLFFVSACAGGSPTDAPAPTQAPPSAPVAPEQVAAPLPEMLGKWVVVEVQNGRTLGSVPGFVAELPGDGNRQMEITGEYIVVGNVASRYAWIEPGKRLTVGLVAAAAGAGLQVNGDYVYQVELQDGELRLVNAAGEVELRMVRPGQEPSPTATPEGTAVPGEEEPQGFNPYPCQADYPSRLWVDNTAMVDKASAAANRVRSEPNRQAKVVGNIAPGAWMDVIGGPQCSGGWVWWQVRAQGSSLEGWTAEGDKNGYWLVPGCIYGSECQ